MDILKLIKGRKTIRKYNDTLIPDDVLTKIIDAGVWGPSVLGNQTWKFIVIKKRNVIIRIADILLLKSKKTTTGINILLHAASNNVLNAVVVIGVYNTGAVVDLANRFGGAYVGIARKAEIAAIGAAIQNMILVADSFGVGACWHDIPLLCEKSINKQVSSKDQLVAVLTLGYPAEKGNRSARKSMGNTVEYI